jgi:hypothetical protein
VLAIFIDKKGNRMLEKLIALFRKKSSSPYIQKRLMKILFNPFVEKHYWVVFDPKKRIWEWYREALPFEVENWKDQVIGEWNKENNNG